MLCFGGMFVLVGDDVEYVWVDAFSGAYFEIVDVLKVVGI